MGTDVPDISGGKRNPPPAPPPPELADSLAEALCRFQAEMPEVIRTEVGDTGGHEYTYADLAAVTKAASPLLTKHGLSFNSRPTLILRPGEETIFVLQYALRFWPTGEADEGFYPLHANLGSQARGSEITYGKRQVLCAVTGIAPKDDDDAAAEETERRTQAAQAVAEHRQQQQREPGQQQRGPLRSARQTAPAVPDDGPAAGAEHDNAHSSAVHAQLLAEKAVEICDSDTGTLDQLQKDVYNPARTKHILTAEIVDPKSGEKTTLTRVISLAKAVIVRRDNERKENKP